MDNMFSFFDAKFDEETISSSHHSQEAKDASTRSSLWRNLTRGDSFTKEQYAKWMKSDDFSEDDIKIIESVVFGIMKSLGYEPKHIKTSEDIISFSEEDVAEFNRLNEEGCQAKKEKLEAEDPEDFARRQAQLDVLKLRTTHQATLDKQNEKDIDVEKGIVSRSCKDTDVVDEHGSVQESLWGFVLGALSGFLGGLIGVRGPPIMIYFLHFKYPKNVVRANGTIIMVVNVLLRVAFYFVHDAVGSTDREWFLSSQWALYVSVVLFGLIGVPAGSYVHEKVDQSTFKKAMLCLLFLTAVSNISKGAIHLTD